MAKNFVASFPTTRPSLSGKFAQTKMNESRIGESIWLVRKRRKETRIGIVEPFLVDLLVAFGTRTDRNGCDLHRSTQRGMLISGLSELHNI